ncbi:UvrD-helicase domain-containing protein [Chloracidobacterium sp. MS 40/45]|uniref:UvrD-helicase domain-containing protein n=1 Tax=Chloracidobacterium aggregatum TaxID=2851959 RepID=UPI001B8D758D|nr:UvrD-helicase domain-containing protein [Chloracidobacterium aggregatum]QUV99378.1 UvrD-helicase domain-containing protein [Chloracidobacterium sp. MS 40/45]
MECLSLSDEQRRAVEAPLGSHLVIAGPGTGKTRTLACRVVHVIRALGVPPDNILAVTYTNKATEEMRHRLRQLLPTEAGRLTVGTFHSFCIRLLRQHHAHLDLPRHFGIADENAQIRLLQRLRSDLTESNARTILLRFSQERLGKLKDAATLAGENSFFAEYMTGLRHNALIDFDDILVLTGRLLNRVEILDEVRAGLRFILVDEFQDTDRIQYAILKRLALHTDPDTKRRENVIPVFAVADDDQSIFAWRGAHPENIHEFFTEFLAGQGEAVLRLETNYRCSGCIVEAANRLMAQAPRLFDKSPQAHQPSGKAVQIVTYDSPEEEIEGIAQSILAARQQNVPLSDMAVLYRRHDTGQQIEIALLEKGIPCQVVRRTGRFEAPAMKRWLLLMRAILNPDDDLALAELIGLTCDDATRRYFEQQRQTTTGRQALRHILWEALEANQSDVRRAAGKIVGWLAFGKTCLDTSPCLSHWITTLGAFLKADTAAMPPPADPSSDLVTAARWLARLSEVQGTLVIAATDPLVEEVATYLVTHTLAGQAAFHVCAHRQRPPQRPTGKAVLLALDPAAEQTATRQWKFDGVLLVATTLPERTTYARHQVDPGALPTDERGAQPSHFVTLWKLIRTYLAATLQPLFSDYTVVDLETTDKDAHHCDVVEVAAVRIRQGKETEAYSQLVRPTLEPISAEAEKTHHISPEMVADAPTFGEIAPALHAFLGQDLLVAHNGLAFDFRILRRRFRDVGLTFDHPCFDTLLFARQLYADHPTIRRCRLEDLAQAHGIGIGTAHRALDDTRALAAVFQAMQRDYQEQRAATLGAETLGILALAMLLEMSEAEAAASSLFQVGVGMWKTATDDWLVSRLEDEPAAATAMAVWRKRVGSDPPETDHQTPEVLAALAKRYDDLPPREGMQALLDFTRLMTAADHWRDCEAVTLMTIHAAKGLEFSHVWLPALEERPPAPGGPPPASSPNRHNNDRLEEERRLLYVGLTRAQEQAVLSWAKTRDGNSRTHLRFLADLGQLVSAGENGSAFSPDMA